MELYISKKIAPINRFSIFGVLCLLWVLVSITILSGCGKEDPQVINELVIYAPHPIEFIDPIVAEFEKETGIIVEVIRGGTGELLSKIEQEQKQDTPKGDLLWGGSLATLQSKEYLFEPYTSINEHALRYANSSGHITRFTLVPSVIMVNTNLVDSEKITGYSDLLLEEYKGEIAFANPLYSASSYEQLLNQLWAMGEGNPEQGWSYIEAFVQQLDGNLLQSSSEVYSGVAEGRYKIGLTFEEAAAQYVANGFPVAIIYPLEGVIVRPDGLSIVKDSSNLSEAKTFVDFATSYNTQLFIASHLHRRSMRIDVAQSTTLAPFDTIYVIEDNLNWSSANKDTLIETFLALYHRLNHE